MEEIKTKLMIFKLTKMSKEGFKRLDKRLRLNYKKEVFKPLGKLIIDTTKVYNEKTLAKALILEYGVGSYTGHFWNKKNHKLGKQAFKVLIRGNLDSRWGYDFEHTRGIARYGWWESEW